MTKVIYFSREGENLINGEIKEIQIGHTHILAKIIAEELDCETSEIQPVVRYPNSYIDTEYIVEQEKEKKMNPEYSFLGNLTNEEILFIGFPTWCGSLPRIVVNFLITENLSKKIIYPFCTHEGSGFGKSLYEIGKLCPESFIMPGLSIQGSRVYKSQRAVTNWLDHYKNHNRRKKQ